jgi:hypothetical protein
MIIAGNPLRIVFGDSQGLLMFCAEARNNLRPAIVKAGSARICFRFDFERTKVIPA